MIGDNLYHTQGQFMSLNPTPLTSVLHHCFAHVSSHEMTKIISCHGQTSLYLKREIFKEIKVWKAELPKHKNMNDNNKQ